MVTTNTSRTDSEITEDVLAELAWDPAVTVVDLDVVTKDGCVTLSGTTVTYSSKFAATAAAGRVFWVRNVTNDIVVDPAVFGIRTDAAIHADVRSALTLDTRVPLDRISVVVDHGVVTLTGSLDHHYQRQAAQYDAVLVAGVKDVVNLIDVISPSEMATDVAGHIAQAFARNAELADDDVSVTVAGAKVTLSGAVRTWRERDEAEDAAWRAPGVRRVVNNIVVTY